MFSKDKKVGETDSPKILALLKSSNHPKIKSGNFITKNTFYYVFLECSTQIGRESMNK